MIQLNFNGASKGNPGMASYGGIFRDHGGKPLLLFFGSIGWDTNNSAELKGLWQGLCLAQQYGFFPIVIEGDSQILINIANQILQRTPAHKVVSSGRLAAHLEHIEKWLLTNRAITFQHVKREGNKVADLLENMGVDSEIVLNASSFDILNDSSHLQECTDLVQNDAELPDAGD